eukprot:1138107-Pelagomonas_calceolata.AAC.3
MSEREEWRPVNLLLEQMEGCWDTCFVCPLTCPWPGNRQGWSAPAMTHGHKVATIQLLKHSVGWKDDGIEATAGRMMQVVGQGGHCRQRG